MRGKDEMIEDIVAEAEKAAAAMIKAAEDEQSAAEAVILERLNAEREKTDKETEAAAASAYSGRLKLGELEAGKIALSYKRKCVDAVYEEVRKKLDGLNKTDYLALMQKLVSKVCQNGDEVIAGKSDKAITEEWVKTVSKSCGKKLALSKERGDFSGGVILRNDKFDVDITFGELVGELKDRTVADVAKRMGL